MLARLALVGALFLGGGTLLAQQTDSPEPYTDDEAYRVYESLLFREIADSDLNATLVIQQQAQGPISDGSFFPRGPEGCVAPAAAEEFKDAIGDYNRLNKRCWLLQRKFSTQRHTNCWTPPR